MVSSYEADLGYRSAAWLGQEQPKDTHGKWLGTSNGAVQGLGPGSLRGRQAGMDVQLLPCVHVEPAVTGREHWEQMGGNWWGTGVCPGESVSPGKVGGRPVLPTWTGDA